MGLDSLLTTGLFAFEHSLYHLRMEGKFDNAFAILHADQAVELLMKSRVNGIDDVELIQPNVMLALKVVPKNRV